MHCTLAQLLVNLRDIRSVVSGEALDAGCNSVRHKIGPALANKLDASSGGGLSGIAGVGGGNKLRNLIKALLLLGANLSQSREFRDLFEDVLTKVAEPLEDAGLTVEEIVTVVGNCYHIVTDVPESVTRAYSLSSAVQTSSHGSFQSSAKAGRGEALKKDWLRFITFIKLFLIQLL